MSEHYCKDCKSSDGDQCFPVCKHTGAVHTTGIECPSFGLKEKGVDMFKVGDRVRVTTDCELLSERCIGNWLVAGEIGTVESVRGTIPFPCYSVIVDIEDGMWEYYAQDLELVEEPTVAGHAARTFVGHPEGVLEMKNVDAGMIPKGTLVEYDPKTGPPIRTFESGATRDTSQGKLDYVKALSPIVLRRYVQYLDKHRLQPDGSYRDFDNWKKGMSQEVYHSSGGRHFVDAWLLTEGYATEDNHGPVELEDALCAELFNVMGRLHEVLKVKTITTRPGGDSQCEPS